MIIINARRWFQKSYGNTYHSVTVHREGALIGEVGLTYGYGEGYLQTAFAILKGVGYYSDLDYSGFIQHMRENREHFHVTVTDVARKRDL